MYERKVNVTPTLICMDDGLLIILTLVRICCPLIHRNCVGKAETKLTTTLISAIKSVVWSFQTLIFHPAESPDVTLRPPRLNRVSLRHCWVCFSRTNLSALGVTRLQSAPLAASTSSPNRRDFDLRFLRPARVYYKSDISARGFNLGSELTQAARGARAHTRPQGYPRAMAHEK